MMVLFIRTLSSIVLSVLCFSSSASIIFIDPYVGLYMKSSQTSRGLMKIEKTMESFDNFGVRLGSKNFLYNNISAGFDYRTNTVTIGKRSSLDGQYRIKYLGAFTSYSLFPLWLDIRGTWFFKISQKEKYFNNNHFKGNGFSIGISIPNIINHLNLNVDYTKISLDENESANGNIVFLSNEIASTELYISVSFPFVFKI